MLDKQIVGPFIAVTLDATEAGAEVLLQWLDDNAFDQPEESLPHIDPYLDLLKVDGTMCVVGAVEPLNQVNAAQLMFGRKKLAGSLIGGISQTQEMLNFCGEHNIISEVELIRMDEIQEAFQRLVDSDVKYRFVIDMKSLSLG